MASQKLTEYEHKRLENIRHNNEIMAALKLQSKASQLSNERVITKSEKKPKTETPFLIRHSFRTRGIPPDFKGLDFHHKTPTSPKFTLSHRLASLVTFCQNRKKPNFDKNVRCNVRREVALRMQRNKGRFTSAKSNHDESASAEMNCGTSEGLMAVNDGSQQQDNVMQRSKGRFTSTKSNLDESASAEMSCETRKEQNFDKKVRYNVRREVALRMQRNKGRFTSAKSNHDESASAEMNCGTSEGLMADNDGSQQQDNVCRHCNISEKCTPMMRRGPEGPRTLCNACGLLWANKICRKNGR